jgi:CRISPR-associated protein Csb2
MRTHFCLTVRFLQPYSHGRGSDGEPEWPPSPLRAFQALVAAAAARWNERIRLEHAAPALRWLEGQPAPTILAAHGVQSNVKYRLYVPDNVADKVAKSWSAGREASIADYRTEKDVCPTHLLGDTVHYLFPVAQSDPEFETHRNTLVSAARSITHLGWGLDMVVGNATVQSETDVAALPGERWLPVTGASPTRLRVPRKGTLAALTSRHEAFLNRLPLDDGFVPVPPLTAFATVGYRRTTEPPPRHFAAFALYQPDANRMRSFLAFRAVAVAGMVRALAGKMARQTEHCDAGANLDGWVNQYVMGHGESKGLRPRFSYLCLPTIRPPDVLGDIRRVIIAEPPGGEGIHAAWARRALRGQFLISAQQAEEALLIPLRADDGVLPRYIAQSHSWASVTPVVLPGSDDGKFAKAEKLFVKALRHAGYSPDALADLEFRDVSFWPRGDFALRFQRPHYLQKGCWSVYHMRLRWQRPLTGPLAIGAGRHCGLGIFAAMRD